MSKFHPPVALLLILAIFVSTGFADTVTLKSGEHLEGKVIKETDKEITMEVQVSAGIVDERVLKKAEVEKIDKVSPELIAFHAIERIQLGPNSFASEQYDPYIEALQDYVTRFPNSVRTIDVQGTLNAFQEEKKKVDGGQVKLGGQWLSKAEVEKEKVQIDGRMAYNYMVSQSAGGDHVGALNTFTTMEKSWPGAATMPEAVELAQKLVNTLKVEVERAMADQKVYDKEHKKGFAAAGSQDRADMMAAYKAEQATGDAAAAAADSANMWAPLNATNEKCLKSLFTRLGKDGPGILALQPAKMRQSLKITEQARQTLAGGDAADAIKLCKDATTLWPANELALRLSKEAADAAKTASAAPPPSTPVPATPPPATPKPFGPKSKLKATPAAPPTSQQSTTPARAPVAAVAVETDERPLLLRPVVAGTVMVGVTVVLAGANVFVKMKKRRAEEAELT